eukprot:TRINITY_DN2650_c0_g1_i2.p1 TRINITY_DN2650_c0_g1~~TRINITY_DN2650_c0_g1_i2.p1  ORF type:complete len:201 (+),score=18.08 TRINITY_DN2650_c0_g1_i2:48-650(+)
MFNTKIRLAVFLFGLCLHVIMADHSLEDSDDVRSRNFLSVTSGDVTISLIPVFVTVLALFLFKIGLDFSAPNIATDFEGTSSGYGAPEASFTGPNANYGAPSSNYDAPSSSYGAPSSSYGAPSSNYGAPSAQATYQTKSDPKAYSFLNFPSHRLLDLFTYLPSSLTEQKASSSIKKDRISNKMDDWTPSVTPLYLEKKSN